MNLLSLLLGFNIVATSDDALLYMYPACDRALVGERLFNGKFSNFNDL